MIIFYHIPKTAGSALNQWLSSHFHSDRSCFGFSQNLTYAASLGSQFDLISGHFQHARRHEFNDSIYYLTLLRHPIKRIISLYNYYRENAEHTANECAHLAAKLSFDDFVHSDHPAVLNEISNFMTKTLAPLSAGEMVNPARMPAAAKHTLEQFSLVGLQDMLDTTISMIAYDLCLPLSPDPIGIINKTRSNTVDSGRESRMARARLEALNEHDLALYDHAADLFARKQRRIFIEAIQRRRIGGAVSTGPVRDPVRTSVEQPAASPFVITDLLVVGTDRNLPVIPSGDQAFVCFRTTCTEARENGYVTISIRDTADQLLFGTSTRHFGQNIAFQAGKPYDVCIALGMELGFGRYRCDVSVGDDQDQMVASTAFEVSRLIGTSFAGTLRLAASLSVVEAGPDVWEADLAVEQAASLCGQAGMTMTVPVTVTNTGPGPLSSVSSPPLLLSYHLADSDGRIVLFDGPRSPLPNRLAQGESCTVEARVVLPDSPGDWSVIFDLVVEGRQWLGIDHSHPCIVTSAEPAAEAGQPREQPSP